VSYQRSHGPDRRDDLHPLHHPRAPRSDRPQSSAGEGQDKDGPARLSVRELLTRLAATGEILVKPRLILLPDQPATALTAAFEPRSVDLVALLRQRTLIRRARRDPRTAKSHPTKDQR